VGKVQDYRGGGTVEDLVGAGMREQPKSRGAGRGGMPGGITGKRNRGGGRGTKAGQSLLIHERRLVYARRDQENEGGKEA